MSRGTHIPHISNNQRMSMKKVALALVLGVLALIVGSIPAGCRADDSVTVSNLYKGEVGDYTVEISESDHGRGFERIVHLYPKQTVGSYDGITGHDYNDDGKWDRVFYCGYPDPSNGCNSFLISPSGERTWEPCGADEDRLQPFLLGELMFAEEQLDRAMVAIHQKQFRVSTGPDLNLKKG